MPRVRSNEGTGRAKVWCFTLNNYTNDDENALQDIEIAIYILYGREVGENGTPHLQGMVEFPIRKTFNQVKAINGLQRAHIEVCYNPQASVEYCKKDGDVFERGELSRGQGRRSDLDETMDRLVSNSLSPMDWLRRGRNLTVAMFEHDRQTIPHVRDIRVKVYWGPTGTGKTYSAIDFDGGDYYIYNREANGGNWFDGYRGESRLIIDEFNPSQFPINNLKRLLDCYKIMLPVKGGFVWGKFTEVIITSNYSPADWYIGTTDKDAIDRRLNEVWKYETRERRLQNVWR